MSNITATNEKRRTLVFSIPADYVGFLLTCMENQSMGPGSEVYQRCLNQIFIVRSRKDGRHVFCIHVIGDADVVQTVENMAVANGGRSGEYRQFPHKTRTLSIEQLMRSVLLRPTSMAGSRFRHILVALIDADTTAVSDFLNHAWGLGIHGVEAAFVRSPGKGSPSHFFRVFGIRYADAFHAWCRDQQTRIEVYVPMYPGVSHPRFYTLWGYRYPVPGLDRLLYQNRELVLLRPTQKDGQDATKWIAFNPENVNFFRKAYEFIDLDLADRTGSLVEVEEDTEKNPVPIELDLIRKPRPGPSGIWQVDKQIDRQRRALQDLEQLRGRLAAGEQEEVYFAYRFDQNGTDALNPKLIRLMQQRLGTLSQYDYAWCPTGRGRGYHLVIANRTQRHLDFSLQPADRVYYQPAQWRPWGANLFLPVGFELAPQIDADAAAPLLVKLLEQSDSTNGNSSSGSILDCPAVLWESEDNGRIREIRVRSTSSLLSQYRLLNSFQRSPAGKVESTTCQKLAESIQRTRQRVDSQFDDLSRDLLGHVGVRTEKLEKSYSDLESALRSAEDLVELVAPKVDEASQLVRNLPKQWIAFVNRVIALHASLTKPSVDAFLEFRGLLQVSRNQLVALALRGRDLAKTTDGRRKKLQARLEESDKLAARNHELDAEIVEFTERAAEVLAEITRVHRRLARRIENTKKAQARADQMQTEIDQIKEREAAAKKRLHEIKALHEKYQVRVADTQKREEENSKSEKTLVTRATELARRREEVRKQCLEVGTQIKHIERQLQGFGVASSRLDTAARHLGEQTELMDAHTDVIQMWETQESAWEKHLRSISEDATRRMGKLRESINRLEQVDELANRAQEHLARAEKEFSEAERSVEKMGV